MEAQLIVPAKNNCEWKHLKTQNLHWVKVFAFVSLAHQFPELWIIKNSVRFQVCFQLLEELFPLLIVLILHPEGGLWESYHFGFAYHFAPTGRMLIRFVRLLYSRSINFLRLSYGILSSAPLIYKLRNRSIMLEFCQTFTCVRFQGQQNTR